ncbi:MAG: GGDEF domain-containing protein [Myxococcales bacterium]|nr:GGDEF domain-containing protein [Myxococcales bacterium]
MQPLARTVLAMWPLALPLGAAALWLSERGGLPAPGPVFVAAPHLAFGAAALLAARFGQARAVLPIAAAWLALAAAGRFDLSAVRDAVALGLPLVLVGFTLLPDRSLVSWRTLPRYAALVAMAAGLLVLAEQPQVPVWLELLRAPLWPDAAFALPQLAWVVAALAGALFAVRAGHARGGADVGTLGALLAALLALSAAPGSPAFIAWSIAAGLCPLLAGIEASHRLAYRDALTGLPGRRALDEHLARQAGRYTVAMVDVDHFKKFNDRHGHDAGDQALRFVARRLAAVRGGGRAFRYGGEEFTLLFPGRAAEVALPHVEAVRAAVADTKFTLRGAERPKKKPKRPTPSKGRGAVSVTVSIGVAERDGRARPGEVIEAADRRLYASKKGGRNRVTAA